MKVHGKVRRRAVKDEDGPGNLQREGDFSVEPREAAPSLAAPRSGHQPNFSMGKQYNKEVKRRRRKLLIKRRKEAGRITASSGRKPAAERKAAASAKKKPAAKKPAVKKVEAAPAETPVAAE